MKDMLIQILAFIITVLALVSVHEYGHYLVARALGIKVIRYAIGFGKPIVRWTSKAGIEYVIGLLPLGGYVKLLDEREEHVEEKDKHRSFNRQPVWSRVLVVAAGPMTNILFAIAAYWVMFAIGFNATKPIIHQVVPNSPAAIAGIQANSNIIRVDGRKVKTWQDSVFAVIERMGEHGEMTITTQPVAGGEAKQYIVNLADWKVNPLQPEPVKSLGLLPYSPVIPAVLETVEQGGAAATAGLQAGDKIIKLDDQPINDWKDFVTYIHPRPGQMVKVIYERNGVQGSAEMQVGAKWVLSGFRKVGFVGVRVATTQLPERFKMFVQYSGFGALKQGFDETMNFFAFNFNIFKKMLFGEISLRSLGGPITIFQTANMAFRQGVTVFLRFLAMVSVMLAFINVLPVPGLDGGHLVMFIIEKIKRGPVSIATEVFAMRVGMTLLLLVMVAVTFNDILRIFS